MFIPCSFSSNDEEMNSMFFWSQFGSFLSHADFLLSNTIGIQNGTLYDVLGDNNGTGKVTVGATSFNVTCGSMDATVTGVTPTKDGLVPTQKNPPEWVVVPKFSGHPNPWFTLGLTGEKVKVILFSKHYITVSLAAPFVLGNSFAIPNDTNGLTSSLVSK